MYEDIEPTPAERKLIDAAAKGETADFRTGNKDADDPANADVWGDDRTIRPEIVMALATASREDWPVHRKGLILLGVRIPRELDLGCAKVAGPIMIGGCRIEGSLIVRDAELRGLYLSGSRMNGIQGDRVRIDGPLFLRDGFHATDEVLLPGATIGGDLACRDGRFENPDGEALCADRMTVTGNVFLNEGFHATGEVRLLGATVGGGLECGKGRFENPAGDALSADGAAVTGAVFLNDGFHATGAVRLPGATVGRDLGCRNGRFENTGDTAIDLTRAEISGGLLLDGTFRVDGLMRLLSTRVHVLVDSADRWPARGKLEINGFTYGSFGGRAPTSAAARLDWIERQEDGTFHPQPYEQAIKVLREMGHDRDARAIAIAKQEALRERGGLSPLAKMWNRFLGVTIGHGYRPWKVLLPIGATLFLGCVVFALAQWQGGMRPSKERVYVHACYRTLDNGCADEGWRPVPSSHVRPVVLNLPADYPRFNELVYSLDLFLPFVDLHQENYWLPTTDTLWGSFYRFYMWFHILLGWVLSTVGVVGLTGIVKKD